MSQGSSTSTTYSSYASSRGRGRGRGGGRGYGSSYGNRGWWRGRGRGGGWRGGRGSWRGQSSAAASTRRNEASVEHTGPSEITGPPERRPHLIQTTLYSSAYPAWEKYLPNESYKEGSSLVRKVNAFVVYFNSHLSEYNLEELDQRGSIPVDYNALLSDQVLLGSIPDLRDAIQNQPETTVSCAALALHTVVSSMLQSSEDGDGEGEGEGEREGERGEEREGERGGDRMCEDTEKPSSTNLPRLHIRLYNYEPITSLKNVKAPLYGSCVAIQGTVVRVGNIKPLVTHIAFQCLLCQGVQVVALPDGKYSLPASCPEPECRGKQFSPLRSSPNTHTIDWQTIRVQELASDGKREAGRIPRTIECELTSDLVDSCIPGDMVTITAVVKATGSDEGRGRHGKDKCMFLLYLHAISVVNNKGSDASHSLHMQFSTKDYYAIQEIHKDTNIFRLLVASLCPTIYGHDMVKAGLVLGLFGGSQKYADSLNNIPIRGDPHILVVGDPGLGKSQMLQAAANLAPRGVYVCGNTTTTAGLTVTLSKEGGTGDFTLEAGALVLADQGCCCIDEFDKMGNHQALLEAMEQQSVSLAKAGVVCSLPARTSILAAANPTGGHYNKAKTVSENLKMSCALLSRFDLVFILLDKPDEETDSILSEHVMALHAGPTNKRRRAIVSGTARRAEGERESNLSSSLISLDDERTLAEELKVPRGLNFDPVPAQLFRKYIGYARKYVHPRLSHDAADILQIFYLELRKNRHSPDSTPITTRQLESLIRLTEARAKLELREEATAQDARHVVEIMKYSMYDTFSDEFGMVDFQRSQNGSGMSQRSQAKKFIRELTRIADQNSSTVFTVQQMRDIAKRIAIRVDSLEDLIFSLNNQNYLLKKGPKTYQLQTAG